MLLCGFYTHENYKMDDNEIIRLILKGERQIFRMLVEKHQSMVFRTCMGFLHDKDDADDLTQDIFVRAYQSLQSFKGEASFSTWIYRIAVNASLNRVRKNSGSPIFQRIDSYFQSDKEKEISPLFDTANPESILISQENNKLVQNALDSLPENQRTAIILSKYDELPQKEIAEIMKTTEGAVEALIQRAKSNLRIKLAAHLKKKIKRVGKI
jgi:RNA polymerase sigma-70 factor (ECF subfamily)